MRFPVVIDSNVPISANGRATHVDNACMENCILKLIEIRDTGRIVVDQLGLIFAEYARYLSHKGQPGIGDAFFKWLWDNQGQPQICTKIDIDPLDDDGFEYQLLLENEELAAFDKSDRKFLVVALTSDEKPAIINATDSDWLHFQSAIEKYGIIVTQICPETLQ